MVVIEWLITNFDLEVVKLQHLGSLDFIGVNFYSGMTIKKRVDFPYGIDQAEYDGAFEGAGGYGPQGLRKLINYLYNEYHVPIVITENGYGDGTGALNDTYRIDYLKNNIIPILQGKLFCGARKTPQATVAWLRSRNEPNWTWLELIL
jgi:beta-glucosidase/6-phospho-beta-glucosidase/beta-galactosidase